MGGFADKFNLKIPFLHAKDGDDKNLENWKELQRWADNLHIDAMRDVDTVTTAPVDSDALVYNATTGLWVPGAGGGTIPFLVAAADATDESRAAAAYLCDGTDDDVQVAAAAAAAAVLWGGRVHLSEGSFNFSSTVTLNYVMLQGAGLGATLIDTSASTGISLSVYAGLRDLAVTGPSDVSSVGVAMTGSHNSVEMCEFGYFDTLVQAGAAATQARIHDSRFVGFANRDLDLNGPTFGYARGNYFNHDIRIAGDQNLVSDNRFDAGTAVVVASGSYNCFTGNFLPGGLVDFSDSGTSTQRGTNFSTGGTW